MEGVPSGKPPKDKWDIIGVILEPVGGLLTAVAVAMLGYYGSKVIEGRQEADSKQRLYTELMSKREESESTLRKDMLQQIIGSFLGTEKHSVDSRLLSLELLAYNFHQSINLKPLFLQLEKDITKETDRSLREDHLGRLQRVAREVTRKQMLVLEEAGRKFDRTIDLDSLRHSPGGIPLEEDSLLVDEIKRSIRIIALEADTATHNIKVRLESRMLGNNSESEPEEDVIEFWVGYFDFPMIDNTRLSHDQRCAIVLTNFDSDAADISVLEFPGSHASLQEKPYFEEVLHNLAKHTEGEH